MRAALAILVSFALAGCGSEPPKPNIVLIMVDTLRADHLGSYGYPADVSPNLDVLARESIVFENCFSQSPWTKPSTASLMTSLYPQVHGLTNHEGQYWGGEGSESRTGVLPDQAETLAESLRAAGYRTGAFIANSWVIRNYGFAQGFEVFDDYSARLDTPADKLIDEARTWLDSIEGRGDPFFLYVHAMDVHAPYDAPKGDYDLLLGNPSMADNRYLSNSEVPYNRWNNIEKRPDWATDDMRHQVAYWRTRYASGVRAFDRRVARLMADLRRRGVLENTYVVVTSDHGEQLFEHGDWSHGRGLWDHQLHVPLIVRAPERHGAGRRVAEVVQQVDIMPTLLSLAGAAPASRMQGRDLSRWIRSESEQESGTVSFGTATAKRPGLYSIRTRTHKLLFDIDTGEIRLFDLVSDPREQRDVAADQPELAQDLKDRLAAHISDSLADGTLESELAEVSQEVQQRLRELGY